MASEALHVKFLKLLMWVGHSCPTPLTLLLTLKHGELANYYLAHSARADTAGSAGQLRLGHLMRRRWRWPNRNQSGNSCKNRFGSWN